MPFTIPGASIGQVNRTGDPNANFAKIFAVNIINAYENACVLKGLHMNQDVDGGDQYNYPIEGEAAAGLATTVNGPMGQIEIEATNRAKVEIKMDDEYDCNIALTKRELKAALNDSIERINKAEKIGSAVGRMKDYILHLCLAKGASTIADGDKANVRVSGMNSGTLIDIKGKASADEITGAELQKAVYVLGASYRRKNIPMGDRYLLIDPIEQSKVAQQPMLLDRDYGSTGTVKSGDRTKVCWI